MERARRRLGPTLIEYVTYREGAHSTSDDPSAYRPKQEADGWPLGDPINRLKQHLIGIGAWSEDRHKQMEAEIEEEIITAQKKAESIGTLTSGERAAMADIFTDVYETMPPHLEAQRAQAISIKEGN